MEGVIGNRAPTSNIKITIVSIFSPSAIVFPTSLPLKKKMIHYSVDIALV